MVNVRDLIGCPYKMHGRNKQEGFDCYGLAIEVESRAGKYLPDVFYTATDTKTNEETGKILVNGLDVLKIERPEPYCIISIKIHDTPCHIGVYLGGGKFIHSTQLHGVHVSNLEKYRNRVYGYYRILEH
jgi:cell wall-associated NlpC family hydrolase